MRDTPWLFLVRKTVIIWGISATPQNSRLVRPKPNEISSFILQRQSLKYFSTHLTHTFLSLTQKEGAILSLSLSLFNFLSPFRVSVVVLTNREWGVEAGGFIYQEQPYEITYQAIYWKLCRILLSFFVMLCSNLRTNQIH